MVSECKKGDIMVVSAEENIKTHTTKKEKNRMKKLITTSLMTAVAVPFLMAAQASKSGAVSHPLALPYVSPMNARTSAQPNNAPQTAPGKTKKKVQKDAPAATSANTSAPAK